MASKTASHGFRTFIVVWLGQAISALGSGLTSFALGLWVYQQTGSVTQFALVALFASLPRIVLSPLVGPLIDRRNRRWLMILSDSGAAACTLAIALLLAAGRLEMWMIYGLVALSAAFGTIQWPAYSAVTTLLVPPRSLGRASGLIQIGGAVADILAPTLAGALLGVIGLSGVIVVDFVTFLFAVSTLLLVRFPEVEREPVEVQARGSRWADALTGWRYIRSRQGMFALLMFAAVVNFLWGSVGALLPPMVLAFAPAETLGVIVSVAGIGMLGGGLYMSALGGPRRRLVGILGFELLSGVCFVLMGLRPAAVLVAVAALLAHLTIAVVSGCGQAIWQSQVPPGLQGRVFAFRQMISMSSQPLAYLLAGPLADQVFNPLLVEGGPLAGSVGRILGTGVGRGIGLMFVLMGAIKIGIVLVSTLNSHLRALEDGPVTALSKSEQVYSPAEE